MSVTLNEAGIRAYMAGNDMEQIMRVRAEAVTAQAEVNASGDIIGIKTGALHSGIRYSLRVGEDGWEAVVGTDANKDGFSYPAWHNTFGTRPWLTDALQTYFPDAVVLLPGRF